MQHSRKIHGDPLKANIPPATVAPQKFLSWFTEPGLHEEDVDRMRLEYTAPEHVCDIIAALGRTEAVRFSPNNRRLAVASFLETELPFSKFALLPHPMREKYP
jgi:hypothetical protein